MTTSPDLHQRPTWAPIGPTRAARGTFGLWGSPGLNLYRLQHRQWRGPSLRIAVVSDPHVCNPWVSSRRISAIVRQVQGLNADIILLAGDFLADRNMLCHHLPADQIAPLFAPLRAPLGVHGILGNHDWKDCARARNSGFQDSSILEAFARTGCPLRRNESIRLQHGDQEFWLVTMDSQMTGARGPAFHDPEAAFAEVPENAPAILLAHEPDYFACGDTRALLQISGHTHGGQFTLFGRRPMTPSAYGDRYAFGHIVDGERHLIVSAGLGYSGLPFRFGVPPELTLIELSSAQ